jgi:hypothetical protein
MAMAGHVVPHAGFGWSALVRLATGSRGRYLLGITALGALYYGAARVGYEFNFAGPVAAIVWLPVGVGIAFLYLGGIRFWPGCCWATWRRTTTRRCRSARRSARPAATSSRSSRRRF